MSETLIERRIPIYDSVKEQHLASLGKLDGSSPTYLRYGTEVHNKLEEELAELTNSAPHETLSFNTGMSAIECAIRAGKQLSKNDQPLIAVAEELYSGTKRWLSEYIKESKLHAVTFDSSDLSDIADKITKNTPDIILAETVGNFVNAPVINYRGLLSLARDQKNQPLIILDNTLPLSTGCDVYAATERTDNVCILESGTKGYTFNQEMLGIGYSKNPDIIQALRERRHNGTLPGLGSASYIRELLPSKEEFDTRNNTIFKKSAQLALRLSDISLESSPSFMVGHPSVSPEDLPTVSSPVVFVSPNTFEPSQIKHFVTAIGDDPEVEKHIIRCDSFGFDECAFFSSDEAPYIRLAPGVQTDVVALGDAIENALTK